MSPRDGRSMLGSTAGCRPEPPADSCGQLSDASGPSTACGPISTTMSTSRPASVLMDSAKATGMRVCNRQ